MSSGLEVNRISAKNRYLKFHFGCWKLNCFWFSRILPQAPKNLLCFSKAPLLKFFFLFARFFSNLMTFLIGFQRKGVPLPLRFSVWFLVPKCMSKPTFLKLFGSNYSKLGSWQKSSLRALVWKTMIDNARLDETVLKR